MTFKEGDLVLKKTITFKDDQHGKFKPNYDCSYLVTKVLSRGTLILSEMDEVSFIGRLIPML